MTEPRELTLFHAAEKMRRGLLTAEELLLSCLERVEARQPEIRAWATVHAEEALERARLLDSDAERQHWQGPLHGIPLGIKDIIDVRGMETKGGTEAYEGGTAGKDAECVRRLREAGAVIMGKLATTPFAFQDPAETRNPWNINHTPGGSSAGSAAAVADRMCLAALGTQTGGSVLRPAAYTGLVGFKPTHGWIPTTGVLPLSDQLDHVGLLARSVEDANLLWQVMRPLQTLDWQSTRNKMPPTLLPAAPRKLWRIRGRFEEEAEPQCLVNLERACLKLEENHVKIVEKQLPASMERAMESYQAIVSADAAAVHQERYSRRKHLYPPLLAELIEEGLRGKAVHYAEALLHRNRLRQEMAAELEQVDGAIMPTTPSPPPGLESTGSARFNIPWSLCGFPSITLPAGLTGDNLPLGVQLIANTGGEEQLLRISGWCESLLGFDQAPK